MSRHLFRALEKDSAKFEEKLHGLTPVAEGRWPLGPAPRLHPKDAGSSSYQSGPSGTSNELLYHIRPVISCKSSKFLSFFFFFFRLHIFLNIYIIIVFITYFLAATFCDSFPWDNRNILTLHLPITVAALFFCPQRVLRK